MAYVASEANNLDFKWKHNKNILRLIHCRKKKSVSFKLVFLVLIKKSMGVLDVTELFHDGGRYHIQNSPLICRANQWNGFYMITASVMKELKEIK